MIGKKKINQIRSLAQKKTRKKEQLFLAEGDKIALEVLNSPFQVKELIATSEFIEQHQKHLARAEKVTEAAYDEIKKASLLINPQQCMAICYLPPAIHVPEFISGLAFYLDGIQDPGNLGTILRTADWFGMEYLFCSPGTADIFNPKVIQSSMGSFCRIKTVYASFDELYDSAIKSKIPVFGTFMHGRSIYASELPQEALIVLGNEGNGINQETAEKIKNKITIPSFSHKEHGAESLNVAVAAGIIGSEFRRQASKGTSIQNES